MTNVTMSKRKEERKLIDSSDKRMQTRNKLHEGLNLTGTFNAKNGYYSIGDAVNS